MLREMLGVTAPTVIATEHIVGYYHRPYGGIVAPEGRKTVNTTSGGPALDVNVLYSLIGSGLQLFTSVYNMTGSEIVAVSRNGVRNIHKPILGQYKGMVIVRNVHVVLDVNSPKLDKYYHSRELPEHNEHEFRNIRDAYMAARNGPTACFNSNDPKHVYIISDAIIQEDLLDKQTSVYVNNRDIVLSTADVDMAPNHPFDDLETSIEAAERILNKQIGSGMLYDIVDNNQRYGDRFAVFGKSTARIPCRVDPTRSDGVYVYQASMDSGDRKIVAAVYSLDEAEEKLGLYRTEQDAISGGDARLLRERELEDLRHSNKVLQNELQATAMEREQSLLDFKSEHTRQEVVYKERISELERNQQILNHRLQASKDEWELERAAFQRRLEAQGFAMKSESMHREDYFDEREYRRKDYYDSRSHHRKDISEEIKFWPTALTAVASAAVGAFAMVGYFKK